MVLTRERHLSGEFKMRMCGVVGMGLLLIRGGGC
jgi:hypothetical protein